jgi:hypothetical protein
MKKKTECKKNKIGPVQPAGDHWLPARYGTVSMHSQFFQKKLILFLFLEF